MNAIEVGKIYSCTIPGIKGSFDVQVIEKLKYKGFVVRAIDFTEEQSKILKKKDYKLIVGRSALKEKPCKEIEIGQIYFCEVPLVNKPLEVQILEKVDLINYRVRVIRCTKDQRQQLSRNYNSKFLVKEDCILRKSGNFSFG